MKISGWLCRLGILAIMLGSSGCAALCIGGAVGGAGGYEAAKEGYHVQSPVQENDQGNLELHSPVTKEKKPVQQ